MRVLHVQKVAGIGGSERHLATLLPALARRGVDVHMGVLATGNADRFVAELRAAGVPVTVAPAGPDVNPAALARLVGHVRRLRPDLVHTHLVHGHTHGQVAAALASTPAVSTFHAANPSFTRPPYATILRAVGRLPRLTIAISEHLGRFLSEHRLAPPGRVRIVPYGIGPPPARPLATGRSEIVVGVASRLVPDKGHADLIDAMASAVREHPRLRLVVAGDGPLRTSLQERARRVLPAGSCEFLGFVDDMPGFLAAVDVFVFPTTPAFGEGFGMAALEASASGLPVVGTAVGPIPEVVADGVSGLLVPPSSPAALAGALVRVAADAELRRRLGAGGARRAREVFGVDRMVDRTIAVYEEALSVERVGAWRTS